MKDAEDLLGVVLRGFLMFAEDPGDVVIGRVTKVEIFPETVSELVAGTLGALVGEKAGWKRKRVEAAQEMEDEEALKSWRSVLDDAFED